MNLASQVAELLRIHGLVKTAEAVRSQVLGESGSTGRLARGALAEIEAASYLRTLGWNVEAFGVSARSDALRRQTRRLPAALRYEPDLLAWYAAGDAFDLVLVEIKTQRRAIPPNDLGVEELSYYMLYDGAVRRHLPTVLLEWNSKRVLELTVANDARKSIRYGDPSDNGSGANFIEFSPELTVPAAEWFRARRELIVRGAA